MELSGRWDALMCADPEAMRIAEAAALIDSHRTGLDPDATLGRLDEMGAGCPRGDLDALHRHLFATLGLHGDVHHYHHERNSLLSQVLDRRTGLPILLSVVALDIARSVGTTLVPIGMPGHFLLRTEEPHEVYLDAFHGGARLDRSGCEALFRQVNGPSPPFDPAVLRPVSSHEVVARILANLKGTYAAAGDLAGMRWVLELRHRTPGVPKVEAFELAAVLAELGRFDEAAEVLDELAAETHGRVASAAGHRARALRARSN